MVGNEIAADVIYAICALGWLLVLASTFAIDHFDLFGIRQVVRHPLMLGFLIVFWATPHMTVGHLVFAAGMSFYILLALQFEERDLVAARGDDYRDYQRRVSMLIPYPRAGNSSKGSGDAS